MSISMLLHPTIEFLKSERSMATVRKEIVFVIQHSQALVKFTTGERADR